MNLKFIYANKYEIFVICRENNFQIVLKMTFQSFSHMKMNRFQKNFLHIIFRKSFSFVEKIFDIYRFIESTDLL